MTPFDPWRFELATAQETLCRLFGVNSLAGFGCDRLPLATRAAGALVAYVEQTHRPLLALLDGLHTYEPARYVRLDGFTRRNLELVEAPLSPGTPRQGADTGARPTLLSVLDETRTAMGGRLLRRWLGQPLLDLDELRARHDAVERLAGDGVLRGQLRALLSRMADVERLTNRARQGAAAPRDLLALRASLEAAGALRDLLSATPSPDPHPAPRLAALGQGIDPCAEVSALIERAVYDGTGSERKDGRRREASLSTWEEERLIRGGYSADLDELVQSSADARRWIAGLEQAERERTGIKGLRVGFNKVFGYYLQVSHAYKGEVPAQYIRRQTLTDGERYITPELKEYENLVLHAQERIAELERRLFAGVQREIAGSATRLLATAGALARLDVLAGFAEVAVRRGYVRPLLDEDETLEIEQGRHPVVEAALEGATAQLGQPGAFVPNGCRLDTSAEQIALITGPNMAGKSTFLRSVALIVLLAQVGSFVPAGPPGSGWSTASSPAWGPRTTSPPGRAPSWWRWWRRPASSATPRARAWSSWTRSGGGRAPTTAWPSPRPWWSTCTAPRGGRGRCSPPTTTSSPPCRGCCPGCATTAWTSWRRATGWSSCTAWCPARPGAATASTSPAWPASPAPSPGARKRSWPAWRPSAATPSQSGAPPPPPVAPGPALTNGHPAVAVGEGRGTRKGRGQPGQPGAQRETAPPPR